MAAPAYHNEGSRLRRLARTPGVLLDFTLHSEKRMRQRGVSRLDIKSSLTAGAVTRVELHGIEERWTVQGHDKDGRQIEIIVIVYEEEKEIIILSVFP